MSDRRRRGLQLIVTALGVAAATSWWLQVTTRVWGSGSLLFVLGLVAALLATGTSWRWGRAWLAVVVTTGGTALFFVWLAYLVSQRWGN